MNSTLISSLVYGLTPCALAFLCCPYFRFFNLACQKMCACCDKCANAKYMYTSARIESFLAQVMSDLCVHAERLHVQCEYCTDGGHDGNREWVYTYILTYIHTFAQCMHACIHTYTMQILYHHDDMMGTDSVYTHNTCIYAHIHKYEYLYTHAHTHTHTHTHTHNFFLLQCFIHATRMYVCIYEQNVSIFTYIYIYIKIYISIYIYHAHNVRIFTYIYITYICFCSALSVRHLCMCVYICA